MCVLSSVRENIAIDLMMKDHQKFMAIRGQHQF